ncbi:MAG: hypothetical protein ACREM3_09595 [Candidatus Rokuibacteriota bacterium]
MSTSLRIAPRLVRPVQERVALYLKLGRNDHRVLSQLLSEERTAMSGVVFDPEYVDIHEEIHTEVRQRNLEAVLDTRMMELATPTGCTGRRAALPWGNARPHTITDFAGSAVDRIAASVAEFAVSKGFTVILSPTHFLADGVRDPWFDIDRSLTRRLRECLDSRGASDVAIYYPLAIPTKIFFDSTNLVALRTAFQGLRFDGIWLRVHPFGSHSGHLALHRYIAACRQLHGLSLPLVAERTGNIGLALLAFGAVGGIESGVSSGERFDFSRLVRKHSERSGFAPHQRVYFAPLGIFLTRERADLFLRNRTMRANFACADTICCRRGAQDMLGDPRRHFLLTRMGEVSMIGSAPGSLRASEYLDKILRPATDRLGRALQAPVDSGIRDRLEKERRRLDGWRYTLGEMARGEVGTYSAVPRRRALRQRRVSADVFAPRG